MIKGVGYEPGILFVIEAARRAGMEDKALTDWFKGMSKDTVKGRLHGWKLWQEFCAGRHISVVGMQELMNPAVTMANFLSYIRTLEVSQHWRDDARPAVLILMDLLLLGAHISNNLFLASVMRSLTVRVKRMSKFRDMFDIAAVLAHIRQARPAHLLSWKMLKGRVAWILMAFVPLRMSAIWKLDPTTERASTFGDAVEVDTREKTDTMRSRTVAVIRSLEDNRLCPLFHYRLLKNGAANRGAVGTLFCTEGGKPYATNDTIRHGIERQNYDAGISKLFTANATRHAAFNALLKTMSEQQVNAFSGHSQRAYTLLRYYYHMDSNHAGQQLAKMTAKGEVVVSVSEKVQEILEQDEDEGRKEELEESSSGNTIEAQGLLVEEDRSDGEEGDASWLDRDEEGNASERDEFTEVGVSKQSMPAAVNASCCEHEGSSTTLINVVIPDSLVVREGGETHNVVNKYVGVLPPEYNRRDGNDDIDEFPPCRQQAVICAPGTIALDRTKRLVRPRKRK
jgi:integrase